MANVGHVLATLHVGPFGGRRCSYALQGGPLYRVRDRLLPAVARRYDIGDRLSVGPFRFIVLDFDFCCGAYTVTLDGRRGRLLYRLHRLTQGLEVVHHRAVLILYVLGLAEWHEMEMPTWRNVPALRRLATWTTWAAANCGSVDPWPEVAGG